MNSIIIELLKKAINKLGISDPMIKLEHPEDMKYGDFSSNIAMLYAKELKLSPKILAEKIIENIDKKIENIISIEIAGPGFINFKISDKYFAENIIDIYKKGKDFGKLDIDKGKEIMIEYTDPNPFKIFHIGHLMANTIGESISRIIEFSGAKVIRACYQGDVGLHVAKTIWAIKKDGRDFFNENIILIDNIKFLGDMYVFGSEKYEIDEIAKKEIIEINKKIFENSDEEINKLYNYGRKISLEYFDTIYKKLGTKFDIFFFESEVADDGIRIVKEFLEKGIFEKSEGAIVFKGEKYGEHTRVFINNQGLPTYEAKELGLTENKFKKYSGLSESIVITANEQNAYFKVILATLKQIFPDIYPKMRHFSHGLLRPASGKMSSRKGNIVSAEDFILEFEALANEKIKDRDFSIEEKKEINTKIAIASIKYTILRQSIGGDIIYDGEKALSFEGDSGPYLQYSLVRANSILIKAKENNLYSESIELDKIKLSENIEYFERLISRFPEIIERSRKEYSPSHITTYLIELSSAFNSYYANNKIIDEKDELSKYKIILTKVFSQIMENGLWILGIEVPRRM